MDSDRQDAVRFWGLGTLAILLSAGAAFSYLHSMDYGIAAGGLIGLRGHDADLAFAQRWAMVMVYDGRVLCGSFESRRCNGALAASIDEDRVCSHGSWHVWSWHWLSHSG